VIAAEKREGAFGRNLSLERPRMKSFFVDVVRVADYLARSGQPDQGSVSVAHRTVNVNVPTKDASEHSVGVALAERHGVFLEGDGYVAIDQFLYQVDRQIQVAQTCSEDRERFFM